MQVPSRRLGGPSHTHSVRTGLPSGLSINSSTGAIMGNHLGSWNGISLRNRTRLQLCLPHNQQSAIQFLSSLLDRDLTSGGGSASCGNMSTGDLANLNGFVPFPSSSRAWNTNCCFGSGGF